MKIEIDGNNIRIKSKYGPGIKIYMKEDEGYDWISLGSLKGSFEIGNLPTIEIYKNVMFINDHGERTEVK